MNAVLGRQVYTWPTFLQMCDRFDDFASQPRGTSRVLFFAATDLTLFGFALQHAKSSLNTVPVCGFTGRSAPLPASLADLIHGATAAFVYSQGHVWAARKSSRTGQWFKIDSLSGVQIYSNFVHEITSKGLGLELVFENQTDVSELHPTPEYGITTLKTTPQDAALSVPAPVVRRLPPPAKNNFLHRISAPARFPGARPTVRQLAPPTLPSALHVRMHSGMHMNRLRSGYRLY